MFLLSLSGFFSSAQQWVNCSPFTYEYSFINGSFISAHEGWIKQTSLNLAHTLYHTYNGAITFEPIYTLEDTTHYFLYFQFVDSLNGWATTKPGNNFFMRTLNGGRNWENITDTTLMGSNENSVQATSAFYFVNKEMGFCNGQDTSTHECIIYKTVDGGLTWHKTTVPDYESHGIYSDWLRVNSFYFIDTIHGWAACSYEFDAGMSLYTVDGGETWDIGIQPDPPDVFDIYFTTPSVGGAVGRNAFYSFVYITNDNFNTITHFYEAWDLEMQQFAEAICFQNDSVIWVTGVPGIIYRSTDTGATFEVFQIVENADMGLFDIQFFGNTGYIWGSKNHLLKFTDTASNAIKEENKEFDINRKSIFIYPNPANNNINIKYILSNPDVIEIVIYNCNGQKVYDKVIGKQNPGEYKYCIRTGILDPDIYILNLKGKFINETDKLTVIK
ncbi:MAG: YCF48-related protein [Bacteroidetes bacterium]|nr:YCF48-related protein [Bacteroidota bacterium]